MQRDDVTAPADPVLLRPSLAPDDWGDALLTGAAGLLVLLMVALLVAAAAAVGYAATRDAIVARCAGMTVLAVVILAAALTQVSWLKIDDRGLRFGRRLGGPRQLRWDDVIAVERAPSREVVVRGWLWPPVPPREATRSLSSHGHFRIEYRGGTCYFPPIDAAAFRAALHRFRPDLLSGPRG